MYQWLFLGANLCWNTRQWRTKKTNFWNDYVWYAPYFRVSVIRLQVPDTLFWWDIRRYLCGRVAIVILDYSVSKFAHFFQFHGTSPFLKTDEQTFPSYFISLILLLSTLYYAPTCIGSTHNLPLSISDRDPIFITPNPELQILLPVHHIARLYIHSLHSITSQ